MHRMKWNVLSLSSWSKRNQMKTKKWGGPITVYNSIMGIKYCKLKPEGLAITKSRKLKFSKLK